MADKERYYQVEGADGMYHSVPESRLKEFEETQEYLRQHPEELAAREQESHDRARRLVESNPKLKAIYEERMRRKQQSK